MVLAAPNCVRLESVEVAESKNVGNDGKHVGQKWRVHQLGHCQIQSASQMNHHLCSN
jgi:hypothetical protein